MEVRVLRDDDVLAYRDCMMTTFGADVADDPEGVERFRALIEPGRAWAAFDGDQVVATGGSFTHQLAIPGALVPMAGLTMVTVRPTHRRRGLLRQIMALHVADARARGEAISGLWASEASIYGRFGFGIAADGHEVNVARGAVLAPATITATTRLVDDATARATLPAIYARALATRPGMIARSDAWWHYRCFRDRADLRAGASARRHLVAERDGVAVGYATFRHKSDYDSAGLPDGQLRIEALVADDLDATRALWQVLLNTDLFPRVSWWNAPVDDPLASLLVDPRRVQRRQQETLWLRIDDVAATLAARAYARDGALRLQVDDDTPVALEIAGGRGACTPTTHADLTLDRPTLAALLLGGSRAHTLAAHGRLHGNAAAIALADQMFATANAPWCAEVF